ncbi:MAG: acyltransferase [Alistipes sp.]|nr:acyltransferase [Alistipes sp.]
MEKVANNRVEYFDFLRGIAIIMVVGIHTFIAYPIDTLAGMSSVTVRQLLNCAVPIFLALSGVFCGKKILDTRDSRISFWKRQIPKVYIPAIVWSLPYFAIKLWQLDGAVGLSVLKQVVLLLVCGYSIYYFIALIIQYYLLLPYLQKRKKMWLFVSVVMSMISILVITYGLKLFNVKLPLILYAGPFPVWFVFFMLGVYYSSSSINYKTIHAIVLIILGFVLECIETYWLNVNYGGGYGIKLSAFIYSIGVVMLILTPKLRYAYKSNKLTSIVAYIGSMSFGIYLIHYFVVGVIKFILPIRNWALSWLLVVLCTSAAIAVARKILPMRFNKYLGFL